MLRGKESSTPAWPKPLPATPSAPRIKPRASRLEILDHDQEGYLQRNQVERLFHNLQQFGRVATRYEKLTAHFRAFVLLALIVIMLR